MKVRENLNILVLGATGSIGSAVVDTLIARGHRVTGLARSDASAKAITIKGASILRGDIRFPEKWMDSVNEFDAVAHCAITWTEDMDSVDRILVTRLIETLSTPDGEKALVYTSGCWNYGATGDQIATEDTPFDPLNDFAPLMEMGEKVRSSNKIRGMVIHPAMVYVRNGGTLEHMIEDARERGQIRVIGTKTTRWTMVHADDIATLYALMIEQGQAGCVYNGAGTEGIEVYKVAETLAARFSNTNPPQVIPQKVAAEMMGDWVIGYALDQQMSSAKAKRELGWEPVHTDVLAVIS